MVFLSLPWSLELYEQVIGRLHRSGQMQDVWVYILLADKTVDEKTSKLPTSKGSAIKKEVEPKMAKLVIKGTAINKKVEPGMAKMPK